MDRLEKDEYGLYIHAPNYMQHRAEFEYYKEKNKKWEELPWWRKLLANLLFPIWLKYNRRF